MIRILPIIIMISLLLGCSTSSPTPKYFTLSSLASSKAADISHSRSSAAVIGVGPVEIPDYLDKPQIVTRTATNELLLSEFNLWGGSLKTDIMRVLIEDISSFLGSEPVAIVAWRAHVPGSYRIPIYFSRLDAIPDSTVFLNSKWGIVAKDGKTIEMIRESSITKPVKGNEYNDIVNAMSDVLADFSKEIASAVKALVSKTN